MLKIDPIPALDSNYIWLLHHRQQAVVVDPGDATPVIKALEERQLNLSAILITHHHQDHIAGVAELQKRFSPKVYAPKYQRYAFAHTPLGEGDHVNLPEIALDFSVFWLPGHTLDHIAYYSAPYLFCGDTLFGAGCGRLFEGTPAQLFDSLNRLKSLDDETLIYCTHEYTQHNIAFALTVEPHNQALIARAAQTKQLRELHQPTLPSRMELERQTNPFLRCDNPTIAQNAGIPTGDSLTVFTKIRQLRNHY